MQSDHKGGPTHPRGQLPLNTRRALPLVASIIHDFRRGPRVSGRWCPWPRQAGALKGRCVPIIGVVGWIAVLAIPLAALLGVVRAMAASASCSRPPPFKESLDRAQLVFVGTAVEVSNFGRWATFSVSDICARARVVSRRRESVAARNANRKKKEEKEKQVDRHG